MDDHRPSAFVYGTLRFADVVAALLGRRPALLPATVADHRVVGLSGVAYPGLVAAPGAVADGFVLGGLSRHDWAVLDHYEDDFYEVVTVEARTAHGALVPCSTYRLPAAMTGCGPWSPEAFEADRLADFVASVREWRATEPPPPGR